VDRLIDEVWREDAVDHVASLDPQSGGRRDATGPNPGRRRGNEHGSKQTRRSEEQRHRIRNGSLTPAYLVM
jgi:hypothetical protein